MKTLSLEQMENVNGNVNWCAVSYGVTGIGSALLLAGCALAGPLAIAGFAAFVAVGGLCAANAAMA